jgi:hypothetical protein
MQFRVFKRLPRPNTEFETLNVQIPHEKAEPFTSSLIFNNNLF